MADQNINIKLLIDAAESAKTVQETKKALRDLKSAAMSVEEGSAAFNDLNTAAGQLQDRIGDLAATTKYLGDDLKNLKGFTSIASGIAGAFAAAQGAAALFGGENKQLEASLLKVQSAMGVLQGIQAVGEVLQKESAATLFIQNGLRKTAIVLAGEQAVAEAAEAVAAGTATVAQRALNAAMTANPILALVALLVTATAALYAFSKSSEESTKKTEEAKKASEDRTKALEEEKKSYSDFIGKEMAGYQTLATQLAESNPKSQERLDLIKKINETYGTTIKNLSDEKLFQDQVSKSIEAYIGFLKQKYALQSQEKAIEESFGKKATLEKELLDLTMKRGIQQSILNGKLNTTYRDIDIKTTPEYQQLQQIDKVIKQKENQKKVEDGVIKSAVQNSITLSKSIEDSGLNVATTAKEVTKTVTDTAANAARKLADINEEYQQALKDLVVETNDNLKEQQEILLSINADTEANAIQLESLEIEKQKTEELKNQQAELQKLVDLQVKIFEAQNNNVKATPAQVEDITKKQAATTQYVDFLQGSNAIIAAITKSGEQAILDIQKDYAEKRKKLLEDTTRRVLATDEYQRFIDFLNKNAAIQEKLLDYNKKFGKYADDLRAMSTEWAKETADLFDINKTIAITEKQLAIEEKLLNSKERNVEYLKEINKELLEAGTVTEQEVAQAVERLMQDNASTLKNIEQLKLDLVALRAKPQEINNGEDFPGMENATVNVKNPFIPSINDFKLLDEFYQKYKNNTKDLFDLNRKANEDQLGSSKESIEMMSALYGEKFNIIKGYEDKINEVLKESGKKFAIDPKQGEIGLKELLELKNGKVEEILKTLNIDLTKNYQVILDTEAKYFQQAVFDNYINQQQKIADNKAAYAEGSISKKDFEEGNLAIDKEYTDKEKTLSQNHKENMLALGVVYGEKTQEDIVNFGKENLDEKEKQAELEKEIEDKKNAYLKAAGQSLYNTLGTFVDDYYAHKFDKMQQDYEDQIAIIDAELLDFQNQGREITAEEQARIDAETEIKNKKIAAQAEYDKKVKEEKTRQFNIKKAMDIIQIGINTAVAVSASLAPPLLPMVPFIIAAGAAEAFFVAAQQPNFAEGGLVTGPGGPKDDKIKANLSNGEIVINAKSSKKYARMLDAINQAGGGKPIPFRDGGMATATVQQQGVDMEDFKSLILDIVNRPIETYVKESTITNAQKSQAEQNRRTSF